MQILQAVKIRIKKGDTVVVRAGKEKGKTGKVVATHPKLNAVTVEGLNIVKKHVKPTRANPTGGIIELTKPIGVSKVGVIDPSTGKASRIGFVINKDGTKSRVFKQSGKEIK
jgi:large subunit ribosomal protein L24